MAAIKKRDTTPREPDPETEARINAFADEADPTPKPRPATTGTSRTRKGTQRTNLQHYDELAASYGPQLEADVLPALEDLPESILIKHTGSKEDALLIHLIAQFEDRSKAKVAQRALLDGLRCWAAKLAESSDF